MRLQVTKTKNSESFFIIKSYRKDGKSTSKVVEKLGTLEEVIQKANGRDPYEWAKERARCLTEQEKQQKMDVLVKYSPTKQISMGNQRSFNGGYLFLQQLYYQLELDKICKTIQGKYKIEFNLNGVLSQLLFSRILYPGSKREAFYTMHKYLESPQIELHHFYRALEILSKESTYIQSQLYKNSQKVSRRNNRVLYYDCTNFFFEIEEEDDFRRYGKSKENRPNPIVQMGLFMDGDGIPLAFDLTHGSTNEQTTLKPLERKLLDDFSMSKFVVCTDAGLSSTTNRKFNDIQGRAFITTQSIKKLKKHLKNWALEPTGWKLSGSMSKKEYSLEEINELANYKLTFYKERWIFEDGLEQRLIITYSFKYKKYQEKIRNRQVARAQKIIDSGRQLKKSKNPNDVRRFIKQTHLTKNGEIADKQQIGLDETVIQNE